MFLLARHFLVSLAAVFSIVTQRDVTILKTAARETSHFLDPRHFTLDPRHSTFDPRHSTLDPCL